MSFRLSALAGLALGISFVGLAPAQEPKPKEPKKFTRKEAALLKQRKELLVQAKDLEKNGKRQEALALHWKAQRIIVAVHGPTSLANVAALQAIGELAFNAEDWDVSRKARREVERVFTAMHGKESWLVTSARLKVEEVDARERMSPEDRKEAILASRLVEAGIQLHSQRKLKEAQEQLEHALRINLRLYGENHVRTTSALGWLLAIAESNGDLAEAEKFGRRVVAALRQAVGVNHPQYAVGLSNLGMTYRNSGRFDRAEPLLRRALAIRRQTLGPDHTDYAKALHNLALIYVETGDFARAEAMFRSAAAIYAKAGTRLDPQYLKIMNAQAIALARMGQHDRAIPIMEGVALLEKKRLGARSYEYSLRLTSLGSMCFNAGRIAESVGYLQESVDVAREVLGEDHPEYALIVGNLAMAQLALGKPDDAERLLNLSLAIYKKTIGESHPSYAKMVEYLACVFLHRGEFAKAEPLFKRSLISQREQLDRSADFQSEQSQVIFMTRLSPILYEYENAALRSGTSSVTEAYGFVLEWKGQVFLRQRRRRELALAANDPKTAKLAQALMATTRQLASLMGQTPAREKAGEWKARVALLSNQRDMLERNLTRASAAFGKQRERENFTPEQLVKFLPPKTALVDFLVYNAPLPESPRIKGRLQYELRLLAFVVRTDRAITRIDLGKFAPIAEAIDNWRKETDRKKPIRDDDDSAAVLRERLWLPVAKHLDGIDTVLVSPDRDLARLPFAALPGSKPGTYLVEEIAIAVLPVPQFLSDLLALREPTAPSLLAVGEVDYGADVGKPGKASNSLLAARGGGGLAWKGLPATRDEIVEIQGLFQAAFPGAKAAALRAGEPTEDALRSTMGQYRWVHLATHGFFAPPELKALGGDRTGGADLLKREVSGHLPGLLSGVVLAGANRPADSAGIGDDGILTAAEAATLDLNGVDMVVLSACETGLGATAGGEGVLGLQRSFQVAGARTVVASLWEVPDESTRRLMARAYRNWWSGKRSKLDGLIEAQRWLLNEGANGKANRKTPPLHWAAFVLSGDWR